ncbi:MAG: VOC family protein [Acidimicrobiia bacterium]
MTIPDVDFDHVAHAHTSVREMARRYMGDLGAQFVAMGPNPGTYPLQYECGNGARLEAIEPHGVEDNDYLVRFLAKHGSGPHHITFVVPQMEAAVTATEAAGFRTMNVHLTGYREAFVHPKDAPGIVVQYIEKKTARYPGPADLPQAKTVPASFDFAAIAVTDLARPLAFFVDLLGGRETARGQSDGADWIELGWVGPGRVRLLVPDGAGSPVARRLDGRPSALDHLAFSLPDPSSVDKAVALGDGRWEVAAADNWGLRLVISTC